MGRLAPPSTPNENEPCALAPPAASTRRETARIADLNFMDPPWDVSRHQTLPGLTRVVIGRREYRVEQGSRPTCKKQSSALTLVTNGEHSEIVGRRVAVGEAPHRGDQTGHEIGWRTAARLAEAAL